MKVYVEYSMSRKIIYGTKTSIRVRSHQLSVSMLNSAGFLGPLQIA